MTIRIAEKKDIPQLINLLQQVLELHASLRPDLFISGTTKYTSDELATMLGNENNPIYVATTDEDEVMGYAFCQIKTPAFSNTMVFHKSIFIDDLCVDSKYRGQRVGQKLFEHVKSEGKRLGCYDISLNVWSGNDNAEAFYEKLGMRTKERQMEYIL